MRSTFLLRFDDVCPTMNWRAWERIEPALREAGISPILAIVPDNKDDFLRVAPPIADFWDRVRSWQRSGWTIAIHGYQHRHITDESGLVGLNRRSEFAGLSFDQQREKLQRAVEIFREEGVQPMCWTAPNHSFDWETVRALGEVGIQWINEGLSPLPFRDTMGMVWVPHQLWRFHRMPFGVWTVGVHLNYMTDAAIDSLADDIRRYRVRLWSLPSVVARYGVRRRTAIDSMSATAYRALVRSRLRLRKALRGPESIGIIGARPQT